MGLLIDWTQLKKESVTRWYINRILENQKVKTTKTGKKNNRISKVCGKTMKTFNMCRMRTAKRDEKETEEIFEIMTKDFSIIMSDTNHEIQHGERTSSRIKKKKKTIPIHIISKSQNIKNKEHPERNGEGAPYLQSKK